MFELLFKYPYTVYQKGSLVLQTGWSVWWWVAATLVAAAVVGWLLFTKWNNGKRAKAIVLWTLQSTMIAIVLLLLWQPGMSIATLKPQQNIVAVLLDDSKSMGLAEDGSTRREEMIKTLEGGLADGLKKKFQVRFYKMGARLERTADWKGLTAQAPVSRLSDGLAQIAAESASTDKAKGDLALSLRGKFGIANSRLAYQHFLQIFYGPNFAELKAQGGVPQRPLWASTGVKNPNYRDTMYVEELVGKEIVNTMPHATCAAFADHGSATVEVSKSIEKDVTGAKALQHQLLALGVDLPQLMEELQTDGVKKFAESFQSLNATIAKKLV